MFALVYDRDGEELARYTVADNDTLNPDTYAERFSFAMGVDLTPDQPNARIPDGCEDIRVTLQDIPGSVVCWTSRNYLIANA